MRQGNGLLQLVLQAEDPFAFAQKLIENWGAVRMLGEGRITLAELEEALQHIETRKNPYPPTRANQPFSIPKDYVSTKGEELARRLQIARPGIDISHLDQLIASCQVPEDADGVYAVPKVSYEAKRLGFTLESAQASFGLLIGQACEALMAKVYEGVRLGPDRVKVVEKTWSSLMQLEQKQPGDVIVFPAQTGTLYAGRRSDWARWQMEHASAPSQWPLSPYEVAWMLVGNRHRFERFSLHIDCPGVRYDFSGDARFGDTLGVSIHNDERLILAPVIADSGPYASTGGASGFFQQ